MCLSCGHDKHIRANGACITCGCPTLVTAWPESITQPPDGAIVPPGENAVVAAAPIKGAK